MNPFQTFVVVDWSGGNDRGPVARADAIWACAIRDGVQEAPVYLRNRTIAEEWLTSLITTELDAGRRSLLGFDFPFGYPKGFAQALTGSNDPFALWSWFEARIQDEPKSNNRFDVAGTINLEFGGHGPFWANGLKRDVAGLPRTKSEYQNPFPERREAEQNAKGAFTCWQMAGAGAVGGQTFMGLPVLSRLRKRFAERLSVWPFERLDRPVALIELWPSLIAPTIAAQTDRDEIKDAAQVRVLARALAELDAHRLTKMLEVSTPEEGWIFGIGFEDELAGAAVSLSPPPLRNDCFALPAGVNWTPVDQALDLLKSRLHPVTKEITVPLVQASGQILAREIHARRANPPHPNSAVDGYGFSGGLPAGEHTFPLVDGRAAAGEWYEGSVPPGHAIRVLTGAALPEDVDTVILEEDVTIGTGRIALRGPLKQGANARAAGEDFGRGDLILSASRCVTSADLALMSAAGIAQVSVRAPLSVAVLSTGDELVEPGEPAETGKIHDANRPMLLDIVRRFGFVPIDMGRVPDDRAALRARLNAATEQADVIITSGGASAGDEDHVSALLQEAGAMQEWRIAVKPGRPLALGLWQGVPVFGLPGNPVAAMVCTLIFARPALRLLAGAGWQEPQGYVVPAAFEKRKKPGRREYLRARLRDGQAEVFVSEGSGRISGLSWAEGLVELEDGARHVQPGDPVRFLPFAEFDL